MRKLEFYLKNFYLQMVLNRKLDRSPFRKAQLDMVMILGKLETHHKDHLRKDMQVKHHMGLVHMGLHKGHKGLLRKDKVVVMPRLFRIHNHLGLFLLVD